MAFTVPAQLAANCKKTPERADWLKRLPATLLDLEHRWHLSIGTPLDGPDVSCSWVAPAMRENGAAAILKLGMPHMEGQHEIDGLRFWNGDAAVRLFDADDDLGAMLLERCEPGTPLRSIEEGEQDVVIARLLRRLWRAPVAVHPFRPLSALTSYWTAETLAATERWPDAGVVRDGMRLFKDLPQSASKEVLLATDLHAGNVLRARREPWLAIDPKPFVGDPAYDATQHLFNCEARLRSDADGIIRHFAELLEVDHERVRLWTFARAAAEPRDVWENNWKSEVARALAP